MTAVAIHGMLYSRNFGDVLLADIIAGWLRGMGSRVVAPLASPMVARDLDLDPPAGKLAMLDQSRLIFSGGGYFGLPPARPLRKEAAMVSRYTLPAQAVRLRGGQYAIIGVGVSNLSRGVLGPYMRRFFDNAALVSVRDRQSVEALRAIGVRSYIAELSDLAMSLAIDQIPSAAMTVAAGLIGPVRSRYERVFGLHLSHPSDVNGYAPIYSAISELAAAHPRIGFVLVEDHPSSGSGNQGQMAAIAELNRLLPGRTVTAHYTDHWTLVALLSQIDGLLTNKLHSAIVSSAFDKPAFAIAKHPKNHNFFEQIGVSDRCVDLGELQASDIFARAESILIRTAPGWAAPPLIRQRAHQHRELIQAFLVGER